MKTILAAACAASLFLTTGAHAQGAKLMSADMADPAFKIATADFAKAAMASDQFETRSSEMAREKAASADVKAYAERMIADHGKSTVDLKSALGDEAPAAATLAPKQVKMLQQLEAADAQSFDALYIDMQAHSHMEAVALFRTYSGNGDDADVKAFAKQTLPTLTMHTDDAQKLVAAQ